MSHQGKIVMQHTIPSMAGCKENDSIIRIGDACDGLKSLYFYQYRSQNETYNVGDSVGFDTQTQPLSGAGQSAWRALGKTPPLVTVAINIVPLTALPQFARGPRLVGWKLVPTSQVSEAGFALIAKVKAEGNI